MPKYLITATYAAEGSAGVMKEGGSGRKNAIDKLVSNLGGSIESFYFAFGETDVYVTCDLPDNTTAAAVALAVNSSKSAHVNTVVLMTPEEVDQATEKTVEYRRPGA